MHVDKAGRAVGMRPLAKTLECCCQGLNVGLVLGFRMHVGQSGVGVCFSHAPRGNLYRSAVQLMCMTCALKHGDIGCANLFSSADK